MHINRLGPDILSRVLHILGHDFNYDHEIARKRRGLLEASAVCRAWRTCVLPDIAHQVVVRYGSRNIESNLKDVLRKGYARHTRKLKIDTGDFSVDNVDIAKILEEAGFGQGKWPHVHMLDIGSGNKRCPNSSRCLVSNSDSTANSLASFLHERLPNATAIRYHCRDRDSSYDILSDLVAKYSTRLSKLDISVYVQNFSDRFVFPKDLTHLAIDMNGYEKRMVPTIFASSLVYLKIAKASIDITWSWFDSGNGPEVWFSSLKELCIDFEEDVYDELYYHDGNPDRVEESEYHGIIKKVHFPVLSKLSVPRYYYFDTSFYKLFYDCPLKELCIVAPRNVYEYIPSQLLLNLSDIAVSVSYDDSHFRWSDETDCFEYFVNDLFSHPSPVRSVYLRTLTDSIISLHRGIAWGSVWMLELDTRIDVGSVYTLLEQMPRLQKAKLRVSLRYAAEKPGANGTNQEDEKQEKRRNSGASSQEDRNAVINASIGHLSLEIVKSRSLSASRVEWFLTSLLQRTPSLLELHVRSEMGVVVQAISDAHNLSEWRAQQLDVVSASSCILFFGKLSCDPKTKDIELARLGSANNLKIVR